ncbi:SDR family NAD(P)-dependent oxidoreductase [Dactylosporangium roseum]|uniref:SDR family NAD(P)-dependent oxidoreductase n=1 Tax=Dactylosporangium roseum TaxID=47989 RepID=A0ABY5Z090_9ACTN|nr:SDR family NAD(P)-dependent oxidoreductase [Dactylosporangium roseum]UWZ35074.1 SDR family NAD(P)-dependent oxidoreductase [Dactylosporangium roseum]
MASPQHPIGSGFGPSSTAADVLAGADLSDRFAIVTGGSSGIGLATARALHTAGAAVVVPVRDRSKATRALAGLYRVEIEDLDLTDPVSIDAFAERYRATGRPLHMLVNSAGVTAAPLTRDARGYELHLSTNHLGHFQLVRRLWPALRPAGGTRVVSVSSWGHRYSHVVFDDLQFARRPYDRWAAYGQSKTANILFASALNDRGIQAFSLHPGSIVTALARFLGLDELRTMGVLDDAGDPILDPARGMKTPEQAAATQVWCATSPQLTGLGGVYCENVDIAPLSSEAGSPATTHGVMPYAVDSEAAAHLWEVSERLVAG